MMQQYRYQQLLYRHQHWNLQPVVYSQQQRVNLQPVGYPQQQQYEYPQQFGIKQQFADLQLEDQQQLRNPPFYFIAPHFVSLIRDQDLQRKRLLTVCRFFTKDGNAYNSHISATYREDGPLDNEIQRYFNDINTPFFLKRHEKSITDPEKCFKDFHVRIPSLFFLG